MVIGRMLNMSKMSEAFVKTRGDPNGVDVSVIIPMFNAEAWLSDCLGSLYRQTFRGKLELSIYDDSSNDKSVEILQSWKPKFGSQEIQVTWGQNHTNVPGGVGFAKNRAVEQSSGRYLCFQDADDIMHPDRILKQYQLAVLHEHEDAIIGCKFHRIPEGSTARYMAWANGLRPDQLYNQIYTSNGPTLIMPTWFLHRNTFLKIGGFSEAGKGTPEDLIFFYEHLNRNGKLLRVDEDLLTYRYHLQATSFSVSEETIWDIRLKEFEKNILDHFSEFTIWNAGRVGRKLYRSLSVKNQNKVVAFCDVDVKKISKGFYIYEESKDLTGGVFESYLESLELREGIDYFHVA